MTDFAANMARVRREQIRWFLLLSLNVARPTGCYSEVLRDIVQSTYADATHQEVRRELDYLEERALVKIDRDPLDRWSAELTRHGVDIVEYTVPVEPGIARPKVPGG